MQKNMNIDVDTEALIESVRPEMAISLPKTLPEQEQPHHSPQKYGRQKVRSPSQKEVKPALIDEYQQLFVKKPDFNVHTGKTCYVRRKYHERISQIAEMLGQKSFSISGYIDNVLYEHFEKYDGCVDALFKKRFEEILKSKED